MGSTASFESFEPTTWRGDLLRRALEVRGDAYEVATQDLLTVVSLDSSRGIRPSFPAKVLEQRIKALVYHGPKKVSVDKVPDAKIEKLTDVVIQLTTTNICGSDLRGHGARSASSAIRACHLGGIAKALLPPHPNIDWDRWVGDYSLIRDEIAVIFPEIFHEFNARMWTPGGFRRPSPAAKRRWKTPTGKANFKTPRGFDEDPDMHVEDPNVLRLMTIRSDDQFNTTIYALDDRFRGV